MLYQRGCHLSGAAFATRAASLVENQRQKHELVESGDAHGVLVYDPSGVPIGWSQFGPAKELPIPGRATKPLDRRIPPLADDVEWRITCFVTDKAHRGRGVATFALAAAVDAIARAGGGIVEGYPTTTPEDGNLRHQGVPSMFAGAGFAVHQRPDAPYVVMRKTVSRS